MTNITPETKKMGASKTAKKTEQEGHSLKGTFVSVMLLGAFILISWLSVFLIFLFRN
ncbi:cytochrome c oxidase subunit 2A [Chengkuizengella axinellae]|uniref:Cytochrome c oxidase subunit 2A n=1 Tax=Chengkuizengella axinellae TaxID=3064388 RepID=A0ABT9IZR8_9BACL|nr:cytochrome c oxidase subunit 2A [Chengkuizengella sp. 2205SS18-9]MDP5274869.1 cytochrome c oxidase subunit 2A [Chengkuizengella sp. 2205SS18-9]